MSSKVLFGGAQPWPAFKPVNDSLRGGKSTSFFEVGEGNVGRFSGNLDITALGGAGFASQSAVFPSRLSLDPSHYSGLLLTFVPPSLPPRTEKSTLSVLPPYPPHRFELTLKNDEPARRPDGRRESVIVYEWTLDVRDYERYEGAGAPERDEDKAEKGEAEKVTVLARWEAFKPTYRGKEQPDAKELDPKSIYELGFMCRSNFGQQAGDFSLSLVSLALAPREGRLDKAKGWLALILQLARQWADWIKGLFGRRDGAVRLP
ncbi:hypothetical protein JCM10213_003236 [Rhodosporidiobolus nylandii]